MEGVTFTIEGVDVLLSAFKNLPVAAQKTILRPGLRKGAAIIKKQASDNVKGIVSEEATGTLAKSIVVRSLKARRKDEIRIVVAIASGAVNPKNKQRVGLYGSVLEFGKEGQPPRPWLRPAQRQRAQDAINAVAETGTQKLSEMVEEAKR